MEIVPGFIENQNQQQSKSIDTNIKKRVELEEEHGNSSFLSENNEENVG